MRPRPHIHAYFCRFCCCSKSSWFYYILLWMTGTATPFITNTLHARTNAAPFIATTASLLAVLSLIYATLLERRLSRLTMGRSGPLEETITVLPPHSRA